MLTLTIGGNEYYDEQKGRFVTTPTKKVTLEHSLKSIAKWESKWKKSFLSKKQISYEESLDYIRCMETTGQIDAGVFTYMTESQMKQVDEYINDSMTATRIVSRGPKKSSGEEVTNEVIYCWMTQLGIPFECDRWHLNRLLTLIEVCSAKSGPQKKMGHREQMAQQRALNEARKAKLKTRG